MVKKIKKPNFKRIMILGVVVIIVLETTALGGVYG